MKAREQGGGGGGVGLPLSRGRRQTPNALSPPPELGGLFHRGVGGATGGEGEAAEKLPTRGANKMPIHPPSFTLIPPTVSFSSPRLRRHKTTNSARE